MRTTLAKDWVGEEEVKPRPARRVVVEAAGAFRGEGMRKLVFVEYSIQLMGMMPCRE